MFGSNYAYWRATQKRHKVREIDWNLLTTDVNYLFEENDKLWDRVSELSALVEFLVEKQEGATSEALSGSTKPPTSKRKTAPKTNSKATKKPTGTSGTKKV